VHDRYKELALVEQDFRTSKTVELEMRPIHVRLESSTRDRPRRPTPDPPFFRLAVHGFDG
jgi:hypothetical protein